MSALFFTQDERGFPKTNVFDDVSPIAAHLKCNKFLSRDGGNIKDPSFDISKNTGMHERHLALSRNDFESLQDKLTNLRSNFLKLKNISNSNYTEDVNRTIETLFDVRNQLRELSSILGVVQPVQLKQSETDSVTPRIRRRSPRLIEKDKKCYLEHLETEKSTEQAGLTDTPKFKGSPISMLDFLTAQEAYLENHRKALLNTTEDLMRIQADLTEFSKNEMDVNYNTLVRDVRDETIKFFTKCLQDKLEIMFSEP
ncbi:hypothetical protein AHF37_01309 [Paragonimus kellicotti]|nr:hypothetical protein AHF37_01309 [Paragonimus kellicotti]